MKLHKTLVAGVIATAYVGMTWAAVSAEEAKKLGTTLTATGAEKAGNAAGTIPPYTGGLTTAPAGFKKGDTLRPDPFADEKPLFSITGQNMDKYADKLSEGQKALLKKYPTYRLDVYPSHRTVSYPKSIADNTLKCATTAKTEKNGLALVGCHGGIPFPIPQNGNEAMWNHLTRYEGVAWQVKYDAYYVDSTGTPTLTTTTDYQAEYPYWDPSKADSDIFYRVRAWYTGPARRAGEAILIHDPLDFAATGRRVWYYIPGQRRVRLSPSVAFDTPNPSTGGAQTYDDAFLFQGSLERFNFKLVGKKEMYVPYNAYKLMYWSKPADVLKPNHLNPDFVRWELHRVWVVEATLAEGKRHIYSKRVFYLDEDTWGAVANDQYDMRGQLYRSAFSFPTPSYDEQAVFAGMNNSYDLISGIYVQNFWPTKYGTTGGGLRYWETKPDREYLPDAIAGGGVR